MSSAGEPLELSRRLFDRLQAEGIRYSHFKSNEHLTEALAGETDLDLLVDRSQTRAFVEILGELDFKRILSPPEQSFPGVSDYLGFDRESGSLVHVHLHEDLIVGEQFLKNHHLPIEDLFLNEVRELHGVRVPRPELELLLLLVRAHLKLTPKRLLQRLRKSGIKTLPTAIVREFDLLGEEWDPQRFDEMLAVSGLPLRREAAHAALRGIWDRRVTTLELARTRKQILAALRPYRRSSEWAAARRRLRSRIIRSALGRRWWGDRKKLLPREAPVLALIGADGSGKTTLAWDLDEWLRWKLRVTRIHLGIPEEHALYRGLSEIQKAMRRYRKKRFANHLAGPLESLERAVRLAQWRFVARHRLREATRAHAAARGGVIALSDRYPLPQLWHLEPPMDGPRIAKEFGSCPSADREEADYSRIPPPTHAIVLKADLATLGRRKDDLDESLHRQKVDTVNDLPEGPDTSAVDATRPYDEVLHAVKIAVWESL